MRTRGWTHWHHLFNPRQLLQAGLFAEEISRQAEPDARTLLFLFGRLIDRNSRLCRWDDYQAHGAGGSVQTFYNQALNPLDNYGCRAMLAAKPAFCIEIPAETLSGGYLATLADARTVEWAADVWITDPGYGDVILYDELSEFFLAWYDKHLPKLFPGWYTDSKRSLSVKGKGASFRTILAECYAQTTQHMRNGGFQVVMFTHQDPDVWADLTLVLWAAGLRVSAAWTIATETGATGIKQGNYVQGTVILVLRKRQGEQRGDMSDIFPDVQAEVRRQVRTMLALDPKDDLNFGDADYQLAAYAAALRVLTSYAGIGEIDVERELGRTRPKGEMSPVTTLIERAVRIASDELVPAGLDTTIWRKLGPDERLYLKGIAVEARGDSREGVYQELARGYGAADYRPLLASRAANKARLKT
ncbi:MAG: DNA methylase, partial [Chloroflexota bacterium]